LKSAKIKNIPEKPHVKRGAKDLAPPFRRGLAFAASAVMLTVIQPPISWSFLAWVSLVPFILACSTDTKPKYFLLTAYIVSLCYWLVNLYWVAPIIIIGWVAFCVYIAVLWPILALCLRYCRKKKIPLFLATAVLFVGAERLQGVFLGGFFWRFLAHSQYHNITIIQISDIFGAGGVSFLIAMVNGLVAELIIDAQRLTKGRVGLAPPFSSRWAKAHPTNSRYSMGGSLKSPHLREDKLAPAEAGGFGDGLFNWKNIFKTSNLLKIGLVTIALIVTIVYGRWRINQSDKFVTDGPKVASLQSNVPQFIKREALRGKGEQAEKTAEAIFDELMQKSEACIEAGAELIVWPETMVPAVLNPEVLELLEPTQSWKILDKELREHTKDNAFLLVGAYGGMPDETKTKIEKNYNSAFLYKSDGTQYEKRYDKIHLVLFSEVLPFRQSFPPLFNLIMKFNPYGYDHSLDAGSEYTIFEMTGGQDKLESRKGTKSQRKLETSKKQKSSSRPGDLVAENTQIYKFSVMICYEATLPIVARRFALDKQGQKQIHWLVNISNDGWFVRFKEGKVLPSTELPQHAAICVFRAVENRLAVIRSVNTGISCLIDSLGQVKNGFLSGTLPDKAMQRKGMAGWFVDEMPIDKRVTFFSKHGQWLDMACAACLVLCIILQLSVRLFRKQTPRETWG